LLVRVQPKKKKKLCRQKRFGQEKNERKGKINWSLWKGALHAKIERELTEVRRRGEQTKAGARTTGKHRYNKKFQNEEENGPKSHLEIVPRSKARVKSVKVKGEMDAHTEVEGKAKTSPPGNCQQRRTQNEAPIDSEED